MLLIKKMLNILFFTNDGKKHTTTVVARDPVLDIALLKIVGSNFPYLTLGNSDSLQVGQSVLLLSVMLWLNLEIQFLLA